MRLNIFSRLLIVLVFITSGITTMHAADALDTEMDALTAVPVVETFTGVDLGNGSTGTVISITDPTTGNSAGTVRRSSQNDVINWYRTSGGPVNYGSMNQGSSSSSPTGSNPSSTTPPMGQLEMDLLNKALDDINKKTRESLSGTSGKDSCEKGKICTITSEKVPGADCVCYQGADCSKVETRKYKCTTSEGLAGFQAVFAKIIRYVINIVLLLGVLAVVGLGIAWSFAGGDDIKAKSTLKTWAINIIIGLLILFMFSYILRFLAPWVYR